MFFVKVDLPKPACLLWISRPHVVRDLDGRSPFLADPSIARFALLKPGRLQLALNTTVVNTKVPMRHYRSWTSAKFFYMNYYNLSFLLPNGEPISVIVTQSIWKFSLVKYFIIGVKICVTHNERKNQTHMFGAKHQKSKTWHLLNSKKSII